MPDIDRIPELTDQELRQRADRIRPVVQHEDRLHYVREPKSLRTVAFLWDPKIGDPADGLEELVRITSYHTFCLAASFKPTIAEVLSQVPAEHLEQVVAFEIPGQIVNISGGCHVVETILYRNKAA